MDRRQRGFSLLELMVAMALGLLISAAAIQLFLANQISMNFQRGMNDVQANGRFAIDQIVHDIRLAGLGPASAVTNSSAAVIGLPFNVADIPGLPNTSVALNRNATARATGAGAVTGLLSDSDQLVVQYLAMNDTVDCEGNTVAAGNYLVARYFVRLDNGVPSLVCDGGNHNGAALDATAGKEYDKAGSVLLSGVDSFQVLYGVDDRIVTGAANGAARIARYIDANAYNALAAPRPTILAVRIGLYLHSMDRASTSSPPAANVMVLDQTIPAANVPADGMLRRLFVTTISLRNVVLSGV